MQTEEPDSTREATDRLVKILSSTYAKLDLKQVDNNATRMNAEERTQLISLLEGFRDLVDGHFGDWDTDPIDLDLNHDSKPFNCKYHLVPIINKGTFRKELKSLMKIGVLTTVQQIQYVTLVFIIPKKKGTVRFITDYLRLNQQLVRNP